MGNLKVNDAEYAAFASAVKEAGKAAEEQLTIYFAILRDILSNAVTSGRVYENLSLFHEQAQTVLGLVGNFTDVIGNDAASYVEEIDAADEYLYD